MANTIFENIKNITALADMCDKDERQYLAMRAADADRSEMAAFLPLMDDNNHAFAEIVRQLSLDNPARMMVFINAVKALGAIEALERIQEGGEFSNWVNQGLGGWINRITAEVDND